MKTKTKVNSKIRLVYIVIIAILQGALVRIPTANSMEPMGNIPASNQSPTGQVVQTSQPPLETGWGAQQPWGMMGPMMGRGGMMGWGMQQPAGSSGPMMGCGGMMGHGMIGYGPMGYGSPHTGQGNMGGMQMDQGGTGK